MLPYGAAHLLDKATGAVTGTPETLVFGHDGHGSVRVLFDVAAAVEQVFTYSAFGELLAIHNASAGIVSGSASALASPASSLTTHLYNGEAIDTGTDLYNFRARWYNASTARFQRLDPFAGNPQDPFSYNKYGFVHGDPVGMTDPTGENATLFTKLFVSTIVGTAIGAAFGGAVAPLIGVARSDGAIAGAFAGGLAGVASAFRAPAAATLSLGAITALALDAIVLEFLYITFAKVISATPFFFSARYLRDPSPANLQPEWTEQSLFAKIDQLSNGDMAKRAIATQSMQALLDARDSTLANPDYARNALGAACHAFVLGTIREYQSSFANSRNQQEIDARRSVFKVSRHIWDRGDSWPDVWGLRLFGNDHGGVKISFADGSVAYIDNGWLGRLGPSSMKGNTLFGDSNVPYNYSEASPEIDWQEY